MLLIQWVTFQSKSELILHWIRLLVIGNLIICDGWNKTLLAEFSQAFHFPLCTIPGLNYWCLIVENVFLMASRNQDLPKSKPDKNWALCVCVCFNSLILAYNLSKKFLTFHFIRIFKGYTWCAAASWREGTLISQAMLLSMWGSCFVQWQDEVERYKWIS